jgi:hypothetical protein
LIDQLNRVESVIRTWRNRNLRPSSLIIDQVVKGIIVRWVVTEAGPWLIPPSSPGSAAVKIAKATAAYRVFARRRVQFGWSAQR